MVSFFSEIKTIMLNENIIISKTNNKLKHNYIYASILVQFVTM